MRSRDTFTVVLVNYSLCVDRAAAQGLVDAFQRRNESVEMLVAVPGAPNDSRRVRVLLRDVVRIIDHDFLRNDDIVAWMDEPANVIPFLPRNRASVS